MAFRECFNVRNKKDDDMQKRAGRRWLAPLASAALVPFVLLASSGAAMADSGECVPHYTTTAAAFDDSGTYSESLQQANNTWEDFIWRGPTYQCPWGASSCSYAWGQSKTTLYGVSVGLSIPDYNGAGLTPSFYEERSNTTSYTFTVYMHAGQFAQPIQVVDRRWTSGDEVGAWVNSGVTCSAWLDNGYIYNWDGGYHWNNWSTNLAQDDYGTYNLWG